MEYPHCSDLELSLIAATSHNPRDQGLYLPHELRLGEHTRLPDIDVHLQLMIEDRHPEEFLQPKEGMIHWYDRCERLTRLADGAYEIAVPPLLGTDNKPIPESQATVVIEHTRTHHPSASFNESLWNEKEGKKRYEISFSENPEHAGTIGKLVNVALVGKTVSSIYSTFRSKIPAPDSWISSIGPYESLCKGEFRDFMHSREQKIKELINKKTPIKTLHAKIGEMDKEFIKKNGKVIQEYELARSIAFYIHHAAIYKLIDEYQGLLSPTPYRAEFKKITSFGIDDKQRVLQLWNHGPDAPLSIDDMHSATIYRLEGIPFNEKFHTELRKNLLATRQRPKEYHQKSQRLLTEAFELIGDRHYSSAVIKAGSAFEVCLKGFLIEKGVITQSEIDQGKQSIMRMTGRLFDDAIRKDSAYKGRTDRVFDRRLRKRILNINDDPTIPPSIQQIRNFEVHAGGLPNGKSSDYPIAYIACHTYAEAISYIRAEGWKKSGKVSLASELITTLSPDRAKYVPIVNENSVKDVIIKDIGILRQYLDPRETAQITRSMDEDHWAKRYFL